MDTFFPILIGIAVICVVAAVFVGIPFSKGSDKNKSKDKQKNRLIIIRDAEKKLKQDPHSVAGLLPLAELHFNEKSWDTAGRLYETLVGIASVHTQIDLGKVALRLGICNIKEKNLDEAFKNLSMARQKDPDSFEVNFYLGQAFYLKQQYDKAIPFLKRAMALNRDVPEVFEFLGLSLHEGKLYRDSLPYLKQALDLNPENRILLFAMAEALHNCGHSDRALKVFVHLRPDPEYGARASLLAGTIHMVQKQSDRAVQDYEIGLKHVDAQPEILTQIRYNLAQTYLEKNDMTKALALLHEINAVSPDYKDTSLLIGKYQEMNQNSTLKTYLLSGNSDFIALCRKMVSVFYSNARVKILAIEAQHDVAEIQTEVETAKWDDSIVFRFYRNTGITGEFFIRDFHGRIRDLKAGKGICVTAGTYTSDAKKFVEGRPIDLIDKTSLLKIFDKVAHTKAFHL